MSSDASLPLRTFVSLVRGTTYKGALVGQPGPVLLGLASIQPDGGFRRGSFKTYGGESPAKITLGPGDIYVSLKDVTQSGDLLGSVARVPRDIPAGRLIQDTVKLEFSGSPLDRNYLYWLLRTPAYRAYCRTRATGTTTLGLSRDDFLDFPVFEPGDEERSLVDLLDALDDRIALLRETNTTLEAIAQALFKSWFVDFDPVRAKSQGLAPAGMDGATAALFPDSFEQSALGPLPRRWRTSSILEVADLLSGGTPKTDRPEFWGGDIAWASAKDVSQSNGSVLVSTERYITGAGLERSATRMIPRLATVVVARGATAGRMVMIGREMAMNQTCYGLTSRLGTPVALYCLLRREIDALVNAAHGSVFDTITTSTFARSIVVQPPQDILSRFEEIGRPLFERIAECTVRGQTLATLRDTLLPRLISGQLRLPEALVELEGAA